MEYLDELNHLLGSLFLFSGLTQVQVKQLTTAVRDGPPLFCAAILAPHSLPFARNPPLRLGCRLLRRMATCVPPPSQ